MFELQGNGTTLNWIVVPLLFIIPALLAFVIFLLGGLPGKIAVARGHRRATAVNVCGWLGLLSIILWPVALIWAYTDPPEPDEQTKILSAVDLARIAVALRRTSDRVAKIERMIVENEPAPGLSR